MHAAPGIRLALLLLSLVPIASFGCSSNETLDEVEKAKRIAQLRKEADDQLARFSQSSDDPEGVDVEALKKYVELHAETTRIAPATCPFCFMYYAQALSRLGLYHRTLVAALERELDTQSGEEKARLEAQIASSRDDMMAAFRESNRQFENYIQSCRANGQAVDPEQFYWIVRNSEFLKEYRRALYYLDQYAANVRLQEPDRKNLDSLRAEYQREIQKLEEEQLRRELQ